MAEAELRGDTYEDLLAVPDHLVAELIDSELVVTPRPAGLHTRAASVLGMEIGSPFDRGVGGPGGWWILHEPELHPGDQVLVPDLAGWRRQKMPSYPAGPYVVVSPDWVCEVISESTRATDRVGKLPIYHEHGVGHVWLIEPSDRTLEVFRLGEGGWVLTQTFSGEALVRAEPFEAIELDLGHLWDLGSPPDSARS